MTRIAGIIDLSPPVSGAEDILRMVREFSRDTDAASGQVSFSQISVHSGWSCDHSSSVPTWNDDRSVCLIFSGHEFSQNQAAATDASILLRDYEQRGDRSFSQLNGWFSGFIIDLHRGTATLFNDRFGLGRVYYAHTEKGFYFASEAKSLLAVLPQTQSLDPQGLAEFISVGCTLQNRSVFTGVYLLPPASCWTFHRDGRIVKRRYFDPATWEQCDPLSPITYTERLKDVLNAAVRRCLRTPQHVGMSLTGGLDSRLLLAWANAAPGAMPCYTFGGPIRDCVDVRIARRLAAICHQPHTTIRIQDDFFRDFATLAERTVRISDGAMDVSGAVELYINRRARRVAPIRLTGNYGSEILRSHIAFRPRRLDTSIFTPEFARLIDEAAATYRSESTGHRLSFIAFKQVPWFHYARHAIERSELTPRSPYLDNELVALAFMAPSELAQNSLPLLQLIAAGNPSLAAIGTDRALRASSLPVVTDMARAWQEITVKAEYVYDYGMPQWLNRADRMLSRLHLERLFLGRHKFYHFRTWYRDQLRGYVQEAGNRCGDESRWYRKGAIRSIVEGHTAGHANRTLDLHTLLSVQLMETFVRGPR